MTQQNPLFGGGLFENLSNVFESDPLGQRALFEGRLNEGGFQGRERGALGLQFDNTFSRFLGTLGEQIRSGNIPGKDESFSNFLNTDFNPQRQLLQTQGLGGGGLGPTLFDFGR